MKGPTLSLMRRIRSNRRGLVAALVAVAALATTTTFTLGGFSAAITNSGSTFSSATIQLEESNGTTTCYSTGSGSGGSVTATNTNTTCTIDALVGTLDQVPGGTALTTTLTFTNVGNHNATVASMVTGACTQATASDANGYVGSDTSFCNKVDVTVANTTALATDKCVYPTQATACPALSNTYNLSTLASQTFNAVPVSVLAAGASATYVVTTGLDSGVATNADQGLTATVPFTWSISQ
ncbi:MAG: hypothetical protein ACLQCU_06890 [Acidimicrobiales bacterium]